ncbi:hypothetical protein HDV00_007299 [Rhizophlyctis rosea]|nr:hypothetical protein HDV00_007299 [Rhizophlyctis rosea]
MSTTYRRKPVTTRPQSSYIEKNSLRPHILLSPRPRILHIAPETAIHNKLSLNPSNPSHNSPPHVFYATGDYLITHYNDASQSAVDFKIDLTDIRFPDDFFDLVVAVHVMEHVSDMDQALRECMRVLKKGGTAILPVPLDRGRDVTYENPNITTEEGRKLHFGQGDHVRRIGRDYVQHMERAGFIAKEYFGSEWFKDIPEVKGFVNREFQESDGIRNSIHVGIKP